MKNEDKFAFILMAGLFLSIVIAGCFGITIDEKSYEAIQFNLMFD
jgi:hypothetical protein